MKLAYLTIGTILLERIGSYLFAVVLCHLVSNGIGLNSVKNCKHGVSFAAS